MENSKLLTWMYDKTLFLVCLIAAITEMVNVIKPARNLQKKKKLSLMLMESLYKYVGLLCRLSNHKNRPLTSTSSNFQMHIVHKG